MMCQRYCVRLSLRLQLLVFSVLREASAVRRFNELRILLSKRPQSRVQQWQPKVIPTPTIALFQRRLPLIGAQHIPPWQLHSCLLSLAPPGSKSRETEVLLVLKAEQYPDNVWPPLAKGCNIYHRRERQPFSGSETVNLPVWERTGGGSRDNTRPWSGEISSSCSSHSCRERSKKQNKKAIKERDE